MNPTVELDRTRALTDMLAGTGQPALVAQPIVPPTLGTNAVCPRFGT